MRFNKPDPSTSQPPNAPGPKPGTPERPTEKPPVKPTLPKDIE